MGVIISQIMNVYTLDYVYDHHKSPHITIIIVITSTISIRNIRVEHPNGFLQNVPPSSDPIRLRPELPGNTPPG